MFNEESGGALAIFKNLLTNNVSTFVNPCLISGSLLLVDKNIVEQFVAAAKQYIATLGLNLELIVHSEINSLFCKIEATGSDWCPKLYVGMVTEFFERGLTKCLIGTRGIFGEGWDSQSLNTLIDLTTATSPVSVKQLRGRSIRLQANDPVEMHKVANNWDVVCIAPKLKKRTQRFLSFCKKTQWYFGICDDGQIECGVSHVHPAFSELTAAEVFLSSAEFNEEMNQPYFHTRKNISTVENWTALSKSLSRVH